VRPTLCSLCLGSSGVSLLAAEAIAVADFSEANRLATEFEALSGGVLIMALPQEAKPGDPLRECWLTHERLRVSEGRSINRAEILTARTGAAAEAAEVAAAEAAAAEAALAPELRRHGRQQRWRRRWYRRVGRSQALEYNKERGSWFRAFLKLRRPMCPVCPSSLIYTPHSQRK
jgi:hypothetical protein